MPHFSLGQILVVFASNWRDAASCARLSTRVASNSLHVCPVCQKTSCVKQAFDPHALQVKIGSSCPMAWTCPLPHEGLGHIRKLGSSRQAYIVANLSYLRALEVDLIKPESQVYIPIKRLLRSKLLNVPKTEDFWTKRAAQLIPWPLIELNGNGSVQTLKTEIRCMLAIGGDSALRKIVLRKRLHTHCTLSE